MSEAVTATIRDFQILNKKLERYFKLLCDYTGFSDGGKLTEACRKRFGFYLYILENVCSVDEDIDYDQLIN
ncbi:hypothetical protein, partial [Aeromonas jandaei]